MLMCWRRFGKPECISAEIERARARASRPRATCRGCARRGIRGSRANPRRAVSPSTRHRHLAGGRMLAGSPALAARRRRAGCAPRERDAEHLHRQPRPQRPGRVVLVADDQERSRRHQRLGVGAQRRVAFARAGRREPAAARPPRAPRARCRRETACSHTLGTCIERTLSRVISLPGSSSSMRACSMDSRSPRPMIRRRRPVIAHTVLDQLAQRVRLGPAQVVALAVRVAVGQRGDDRARHVADVHRLEARLRAGEHDHRQEARQRREQVEERVLGPEDHRGAEHGDREILGRRAPRARRCPWSAGTRRAPAGRRRARSCAAAAARPPRGRRSTTACGSSTCTAREIRAVVVRAALVAPPAPAVQHADQVDRPRRSPRRAARARPAALTSASHHLDRGQQDAGAWRARGGASAPSRCAPRAASAATRWRPTKPEPPTTSTSCHAASRAVSSRLRGFARRLAPGIMPRRCLSGALRPS